MKQDSKELSIYNKKAIAESNRLMKSVQNDLTRTELQLVLLIASQVEENDDDFINCHVSMVDLKKLLFPDSWKNKNTREQVEKIIISLASKVIVLKSGYNTKIFHWLDEADIDDKKEFVSLRMGRFLKEYFLRLSKEERTIYKIGYILNFKRKTSINLYRWAYSKVNFCNGVSMSISDAKLEIANNPDVKTNDLFRYHIEPAVAEINEKSDLTITYLPKKAGGQKKQYTSIEFWINKKTNPKMPKLGIEKKNKENPLSEDEIIDIIDLEQEEIHDVLEVFK